MLEENRSAFCKTGLHVCLFHITHGRSAYPVQALGSLRIRIEPWISMSLQFHSVNRCVNKQLQYGLINSVSYRGSCYGNAKTLVTACCSEQACLLKVL